MGQMIPTFISDFSGGMVNDPRTMDSSTYQTLQHFDAFTNPHKLSPYRSHEVADASASTNKIANFAYDGTRVYGLAQSAGTGPVAILTRTDFTGSTWGTTNGSSNIGGSNRADADTPAFVYYTTKSKLYGVRGGRYVWSFAPASSTVDTSAADLTAYTTVSNAIVHSKDDTLYLGYDNKIATFNKPDPTTKVPTGLWETPGLTLPSNFIVTSICEYNNYLAIACRPTGGGNSRVFLWDRDSSVTTLSESIDWGEGNLMLIEELEGYLVGVSFVGTTGSYSFKGRTVFRAYAGSGGAQKFQEFIGFSQTPAIQGTLFKHKVNNRILFPASIPIVTTGYFGIWSIGKVNGHFVVSLDRNYTTAFNSSITQYGLILLGDYLFTGYSMNNTHFLEKTDDTELYGTGIYESVIFNAVLGLRNRHIPDSSQKKKLIGATVTFEPLPAGATVVLKYKLDSDSSWTQIFTYTSTNAIHHSAVNIESTGANLPEGKEIQFRIESTGGAVITGLSFEQEITGGRLY